MKYILIPLLLLALPGTLGAQSLRADEALQRALAHIQSVPVRRQQPSRMRTLQQAAASRWTLAHADSATYIFDAPDGGLIICPTTASLPPLLGYTDRSSYAAARHSHGFQQMLDALQQAILQSPTTTSASSYRIFKPKDVDAAVPPLLTDRWHQYAPFNRLCPVTTEGDTCVTGCVAHAMAQVMRYWQWPVSGTGSYSYHDTLGSGQTLTADFASHTYRWEDMLDTYDDPTAYTPAQADAVAQLISDCGIAVDMRYTAEASAAQTIKQCRALVNHFGYDDHLQELNRNFFPQEEWDSLLFTELSLRRPILLGGYSTSLAHAFVCDGYDETGFFHIRFGNPDCEGDGYFYFNWMTPDMPRWHDVDNPETGLNAFQTITIGIQPQGRSAHSHAPAHFFGFSHLTPLPASGETDEATAASLIVHYLSNLGWNSHDGAVGLVVQSLESADDVKTPVYTYAHAFPSQLEADTAFTDTIRLSSAALQALPSGTYRLQPAFQEPWGDWTLARAMVGTPSYLLLHIATDGSASLADAPDLTSDIQVSLLQIADSIERGSKPHIQFQLTNNGAEFSGRLILSFVDSPSAPLLSGIFFMGGLSIQSGESQLRQFNRTALNGIGLGKRYLRIMTDIDVFTDSLTLLYADYAHPITILPQGWTGINSISADDDADDDERASRWFTIDGRATQPESNPTPRILLRKQGQRWQKVVR